MMRRSFDRKAAGLSIAAGMVVAMACDAPAREDGAPARSIEATQSVAGDTSATIDGPPENTAGEPVTYVERDSAGILIVTNESPLWGDTAKWSISAKPLIDIGEVDGAPEYLFTRAHAARRLSDGRIILADGGSAELRYYDSTGRFLERSGRRGQGPGEWYELSMVRSGGGDSSLVIEPHGHQTLMSPSGTFVRRFALAPVPNHPGTVHTLGKLTDGSILGYSLGTIAYRTIDSITGAERRVTIQDRRKWPEGLYRALRTHFLFDAEGRLIDSVGVLPGPMYRAGGIGPHPYWPRAIYELRDDMLYFSTGDRNEIRAYAVSGGGSGVSARGRVPSMQLRRIIRQPGRIRPMTERIIKEYKEGQRIARRDSLPAEPASVIEFYLDRRLFPPRLPAHSKLIADPTGHLWVEEYPAPGSEGSPSSWSIFDPLGRWVTTAELPPRFSATDIGLDYVLGFFADTNDVQHLRMYRIERATR